MTREDWDTFSWADAATWTPALDDEAAQQAVIDHEVHEMVVVAVRATCWNGEILTEEWVRRAKSR